MQYLALLSAVRLMQHVSCGHTKLVAHYICICERGMGLQSSNESSPRLTFPSLATSCCIHMTINHMTSNHVTSQYTSVGSHHASLSMQACPCTAQSNVASCMSVTLGATPQQVYLSKSSLCPRKPRISTDSAECCASSVCFDESSLPPTGSVEDDLL